MSEKHLRGLANGDINSFEWLFDHYYDKVFHFTLKLVQSTWVAEEITQNVFLKIWVNKQDIRVIRTISSYMFSIAKNEAFDYFRIQEKEKKYGSLRCHPIHVDEEEETIGKIDKMILHERIDQYLSVMPEKRRKIFILNKYEYKHPEEIAKIMGISKRTVEKHIQLAMEDLRKMAPFLILLFFIYNRI